MIAFGTDTWDLLRAEEAPRRAMVNLSELKEGLVGGTEVATPMGWRAIESIEPGDLVRIRDKGMQPVLKVDRLLIWEEGVADPANWLVHIPAGVLGNRKPVSVLPRQRIVVEKNNDGNLFNDPFAMIPAAALEGFRQITRMAPAERLEVFVLQIAEDGTLDVNGGVGLGLASSRGKPAALAA